MGSSEGAQGIVSKISFSKSVRSKKKDEVCHSFIREIFNKFLHRGGFIQLVIIVLVTNKIGRFKLDQTFQEAKLTLVPGKECKELVPGLEFRPDRDLCAAKKYVRYIDVYKYYPKRKKPSASWRCPFCPKFQRVRIPWENKDKEIRYGKVDSCSGDSGGPLWKWIGKKNAKATVPPNCLCLVRNTQDTLLFYKIEPEKNRASLIFPSGIAKNT